MVRVENAVPISDPFYPVFKNNGLSNPKTAELEKKREKKKKMKKLQKKAQKKKKEQVDEVSKEQISQTDEAKPELNSVLKEEINKMNQLYEQQKQAQQKKKKTSPNNLEGKPLKSAKVEKNDDEESEESSSNSQKEELEEKPIVAPEPNIIEKPKHFAWNMTDQKFSDLDVCEKTKEALEIMGFKNLTEIQARSIPPLLKGADLLAKAKTGSGKTLAFLIPAIEVLFNNKFIPQLGTGAIAITPTRELALQIYSVAHELLQKHNITHGLLIGGANRSAEAEKLRRGCNLIIATPGRLVDHLTNTKDFRFKNLKVLILDETDRILDTGFEQDLRKIISVLPKKRQTMLFSATQTSKVEELARLAIQSTPVQINVDDKAESATVTQLEQGYVIIPSQHRFLLLFTFLKKNIKKKIIVFFSSCKAVKYYAELLNYIDVPVYDLHGDQKQNKRTHTFFEFCNATTGILLCTDVAARGLDIPRVDWIIQYDPPDEPSEYIHRVGRTARGGAGGRALLFLLPSEVDFLFFLKKAKVRLDEYEFPKSKLINVQTHLEGLIEKNYHLHNSSRAAYKSYIRAYCAHKHKSVFDVTKLDLVQVAKSFGFSAPPRVDFNIDMKPDKKKERTFSN